MGRRKLTPIMQPWRVIGCPARMKPGAAQQPKDMNDKRWHEISTQIGEITDANDQTLSVKFVVTLEGGFPMDVYHTFSWKQILIDVKQVKI